MKSNGEPLYMAQLLWITQRVIYNLARHINFKWSECSKIQLHTKKRPDIEKETKVATILPSFSKILAGCPYFYFPSSTHSLSLSLSLSLTHSLTRSLSLSLSFYLFSSYFVVFRQEDGCTGSSYNCTFRSHIQKSK